MGIDAGAKGSSMATINVVPWTDILLVLVVGTVARFAQSLKRKTAGVTDTCEWSTTSEVAAAG